MRTIKIENGMYQIYEDNKKLCACSLKNSLRKIVEKFLNPSGDLTPQQWLEITNNSIDDISYYYPDSSPLGEDFLDNEGNKGLIDLCDGYTTTKYDLNGYELDLSDLTWSQIIFGN